MLDIVEGDVLTIDAKDITVKAVGEWEGFGTSNSMLAFMTKTAATKRAVVGAGKRTAPQAYLSNLKATPMYPVAAEAQIAQGLETGYELKSLYVGDATGFLEVFVAVRK